MNPLIPGNPIWPGGILAPLGNLLFWVALIWLLLTMAVLAVCAAVDWWMQRDRQGPRE